ncbi:MAG: lytic transglycosylase domain-containing protein [Cellulosilyticaceae bacterium]
MNSLKIIKGILYTIVAVLISIPILYWSYPTPYEEWIASEAKAYGVDPLLIYAMIKVESGFDENALSRSGAKGLMQIMDGTGKWGAEECGLTEYTTNHLFNPRINIKIGVWYIARLINQYKGDIDTALTAYNAGSGNVAKWKGNQAYSQDGIKLDKIPFKETASYIKKVNFHYKIYHMLY